MEPDRPKVDWAVLAFLKSEALHPADFTIREDGVVRLNQELARRVSRTAVAKDEPVARDRPARSPVPIGCAQITPIKRLSNPLILRQRQNDVGEAIARAAHGPELGTVALARAPYPGGRFGMSAFDGGGIGA